MIHAKVFVTLKNGVSDPQGAAIGQSLKTMGFSGISNVRQGKVIEIELENGDPAQARTQLDAMCRQLLANTVIEDYDIEIAS
jgi:phosphoribosylformylglycinamidine synthase